MADETAHYSEFPCPGCHCLFDEKTGKRLDVKIESATKFSDKLCQTCEQRPWDHGS